MITELNHYNVRTVDLDRSVQFYREVLGLVVGPRPNFDFPGAWMYCGPNPVVHLMQRGDSAAAYTGARRDAGEAAPATGRLDHVAFTCQDLRGFRAKLESLGVKYLHREVPGGRVTQIFVDDPDGVRIELNFPRDE